MVELVAFKKEVDTDHINNLQVARDIIDAGNCAGFALVLLHKSGEVTTIVTKSDDQFRLLAGVERLAFRINTSMS